MGYYKPFPARIQRGQRFGDNPGWGPNPPGGHNGDDYLSQVGEPVYAAGDGVVVFAGRFDSTYADNWGWNLNFGGQMVVLNLDGPNGPYVEYGHNSELRVSTGDRVNAGQVIALSGEDDGGTHVITGPHLHVGCLPPNFDLNSPTYGRVNPDLYLTDYPDETGTISAQSATITPTEEDDMFTDADRALLQATLNKADGGTLRADTQWQNGILADISARLGQTLNKADGGYIVGLLNAVKPGATDAGAIAEAVVSAVGKDVAAEVVKSLGEKLGSA